jgi:transcriptional regulator with XRE-family HTH domain
MTFGQTIKALRKEANMTQENLAELLSISPQAVSRWETDVAMPDISLLPPLAIYLT